VNVTRKIGRDGIDALPPNERAAVAADVDLGVATHRDRILGIFGATGAGPAAHGGADPVRRERMYQVMTVWDETMAESAARALEAAGPRSRMLVVAGVGHVSGFDGIPDRLARRVPGLEPLVIACRSGEELDFLDADLPPWRVAHFIVRTEEDERGDAPRLGAQFKEGSLVVERVVPGGNAERIGLAPGDVVESLACPDGSPHPLRDVTDLRVALDLAWRQGGRGCRVQARRADGTALAKAFDLEPPAAQ
jgi:hypothetical protein